MTSESPSAQELIFHLSAEARVTTVRAIFGTATYAIGDIAAATMSERLPARRLGYALLGVAALIALGTLSLGGFDDLAGLAPGLGIALLVGALGLYRSVSARPTYAVYLQTLGGEVEALSSPDKRHATEVVEALNKAISRRGRL